MMWLLLAGAIVFEVTGTLSLRAASESKKRIRWGAAIVGSYALAFTLLTATLASGMPLGVAYGIWAAAGVALTAVASRFLFHEPLNRIMILGIALIAGGVLLIELGATH